MAVIKLLSGNFMDFVGVLVMAQAWFGGSMIATEEADFPISVK